MTRGLASISSTINEKSGIPTRGDAFLLRLRRSKHSPQFALCDLPGGKGIAHPGDRFPDLLGQFQQPEHLVDPGSGDPELPGQGDLGCISPAPEHLLPLPGKDNGVPAIPLRPGFPRLPPVGEYVQPEHRTKGSIF